MSGRLAVVGLGPGSAGQLTAEALAELRSAELIVGYRGYLELLPQGVGARREAYELGEERRRARRALEAAAAGARVALVSSGDPGVYGMAGLALAELGELAGREPEVVVMPGVTAATAAAALLGAPLAVDFACLSLSDVLVPARQLEGKLEALAAADIALALYNPASGRRRRPWEIAVTALQRHRRPDTPAAAVRRAYRSGQSLQLAEVGTLAGLAVDMETVVVVGCSRTRRLGDWLVTLRDGWER